VISDTWLKFQKRAACHPQIRPIVRFIRPTLSHTIVYVTFVTFIAPRHVLFASSIFVPSIFMCVLTVTTSIAVAVLTTTALMATGLIPIPPPN
jgi:hypothetical protein